jgi:hypothetical protein
MNPSEEEFVRAANRLKVINGSYTMYRNLVLADSSGKIVACSKTELLPELKQLDVKGHVWFEKGGETGHSNQYAVQDVMHSSLEEPKERSLVYAGGVRKNGARQGAAIGVLGILFDWDREARTILTACLPKCRSGNVLSGSAAVYLNASSEVIETSDSVHFPVGAELSLPDEVQRLDGGDKVSGVITIHEKKYIYGACKTKGYREYPGLSWTACVFRPVSADEAISI